ncbi:MAG: 3-deoxy-7-phosphoheptulonate synthase [Xanthomonadaceae bacterium]|nr:3-deoxy-7-phosphoheptulonate synthase [Xanthomonadaceae bacterium]
MIIVLKPEATHDDAQAMLRVIEAQGLQPLYLPGVERIVLGALGDERVLRTLRLDGHPLVESVKPILTPYKRVSREMQRHDTQIDISSVTVGGRGFVVMAGPCAVENHGQVNATAAAVRESGARVLRGGAFKPRTSPYAFQGHGEDALKLLADAGRAHDMPIVTEVVDPADVELVAEHADALQVGARNMQNYRLLQAVGRASRPVLLKRGMSATIEELLLAAEYIMDAGNPNVILCERGIRTFETATRNTLDLNAVAVLKLRSHLPVVVDPSHGTGVRELVAPMAKAAIGAGADGLIIEVHCDPASALSDGAQSLDPDGFARLMREIAPFVEAAGRTFAA